jgi:hypothetical protein
MSDYDAKDKDKIVACQEKAFQQLLAYTYMESTDKAKYGSLLTGLQTQQSLENNQYPKTIMEANNVLSVHRFDSPTKKSNDKPTKETDK